MEKKTVIIIISVIAGLCLICACIAGIGIALGVGLTQPVRDQGDAFMQALKDSRYPMAYNMCDKDLQSELGSPAGLQSLVETNGVSPESWSFSSSNIENDRGVISGTTTLKSGTTVGIEIIFRRAGDQWKITSFSFR